jgi:Tol biopolymer transport system component
VSSSEHFHEVQELFLAALDLPTAERRTFLDVRCHENASLRQDVESLLGQHARGSDFMRTGDGSAESRLVLESGTRLGPYEISELIATGGMGEVYRARDTKLRREVALKVLPESFIKHPERVARFQREAQVVASLNHPNIAAVYGLEESGGVLALVMELVDGPTLAARIASGPLAIEEASGIAYQIIDALEAAHERGIVHRDLKPGNVKITSDGLVKVLDFGLAKVLDERSSLLDAGSSLAATHDGVILGTAPYMSAEQARGAAVDKRADIWAFGVVFYEMLTGGRPFGGGCIADVLGSILKDEPDLSALPPDITAVVRRCLNKDPRNRWGSMGDVRWALQALRNGPAPSAAPAGRGRYLPLAAAALLTAAAAVMWFGKPKPAQPLLQMEITAPEGTTFGSERLTGQLALSPDGQRLAFLANGKDGKSRLWIRSLESGKATALPGTEDVGLNPFWSPDSRWIAFNVHGALEKSDVVAGGSPQLICECAVGIGTWNSDGLILTNGRNAPIQRVSAAGGRPTTVFDFDRTRGEHWMGAPDFLPDGKRFIYGTFTPQSSAVLASIDGKLRRPLFETRHSPAMYAPNPAGGGWLLYVDDGELLARAFDPAKGVVTGEPSLVVNTIPGGPSWSTSANGILAFRHDRANQSQLSWFSREGTALSAPIQTGNLNYPRISPDQKTIAFVRIEDRNSDIWLFDIPRNASARFTSEPEDDNYPVWSRDGSRIIHSSLRGNDRWIVERPANGVGQETLLRKGAGIRSPLLELPFNSLLPTDVSADGRWIITSEIASGGTEVVSLLSREENAEPIRYTGAIDATLSPDGRWLLFSSGRIRPEVFVQSVPPQRGGKWQISTAGGGNPVWRGDGKEIFYLAADGKMMSVVVESHENFFRPGASKPLFQTRMVPTVLREYDVTRDGHRFLLNVPVADQKEEPITVIINWPKLLQK